MISYEPIWTIGSGRSATYGDIVEIHADIRRVSCSHSDCSGANILILYGGSVTGDNAGAILSLDDVDGVWVGSASLTAARMIPVMRSEERRVGKEVVSKCRSRW